MSEAPSRSRDQTTTRMFATAQHVSGPAQQPQRTLRDARHSPWPTSGRRRTGSTDRVECVGDRGDIAGAALHRVHYERRELAQRHTLLPAFGKRERPATGGEGRRCEAAEQSHHRLAERVAPRLGLEIATTPPRRSGVEFVTASVGAGQRAFAAYPAGS